MRIVFKQRDWEHKDIQTIFPQVFDVDIQLDHITTHWFVGYIKGQAVSLAGLSKCTATVGHLELAGVIPAFQGFGIQKKMIRFRENLAYKLGYTKLITYTAHWNSASCNSLISCGYKTYRPQYAWGGSEYIYWWKNI